MENEIMKALDLLYEDYEEPEIDRIEMNAYDDVIYFKDGSISKYHNCE